jgi:hypothetical protein
MSDINALTKTLIKIQKEDFPEVPPDLITEILKIQDSFSQNRSDSMKKIGKIVEEFLNSKEFE